MALTNHSLRRAKARQSRAQMQSLLPLDARLKAGHDEEIVSRHHQS
jgi:hypothetical protein